MFFHSCHFFPISFFYVDGDSFVHTKQFQILMKIGTNFQHIIWKHFFNCLDFIIFHMFLNFFRIFFFFRDLETNSLPFFFHNHFQCIYYLVRNLLLFSSSDIFFQSTLIYVVLIYVCKQTSTTLSTSRILEICIDSKYSA